MKSVELYTDGACSQNPGPGGWACILVYQGKEKTLSGGEPQTTNNRMELQGVIHGLEQLKEPCRVALYTDSKYVSDAIGNGWAKAWEKRGWKKADKSPAKNPELWEKLLRLLEIHEVTAHWVKGHAENEYNNRCDALAVAERKKYE
jgi:ribonuclease HI